VEKLSFADSRTAFDELPGSAKKHLLTNGYFAAHSLLHSRKTAAPEYFKGQTPENYQMVKHILVQLHEPMGRMNL
jgi:alpha-ketoglutarate-dependent 2,4-dichlorophenoxyacetate dioxygenase